MNLDRICCTPKIAEEIPLKVQLFLINLIEERHKNKRKLDKLQIFDLERDFEGNQSIRHMQENPNFLEELILISDNFTPVTCCIFIILEAEKTFVMYQSETNEMESDFDAESRKRESVLSISDPYPDNYPKLYN